MNEVRDCGFGQSLSRVIEQQPRLRQKGDGFSPEGTLTVCTIIDEERR
jgi:hypothetical protein